MRGIIAKLIPGFLKKKLKKELKKRDFKKFKDDAQILTLEYLIKKFSETGIEKGDTIYVHSSLKGLGYIEGGGLSIIKALQEVIGEEGTLVFPTFTIDGSMLKTLESDLNVFDVSHSKSTVGSITNTFLQLNNVIRSVHPTHSVAAWGENAKFITDDHEVAETNFGVGAPFEKIHQLNGKVVGLGINYAHVTYYHVYEDLNLELFPQVYLPNRFKSKAITKDGEEIEMNILCHNPEFHKTRIEKDANIERYFANYLESNEVSFRSKIGQGHIWWMHSRKLIEHLDILFKQGISIYEIPEIKNNQNEV